MTTKPLQIQIDSRVFNDTFLPLLNNQDRLLLLYGGAGSGKSVFAAQKKLFRVLNEPNSRFLITRKIARTLRNSVFQLFRDLIAQWDLGDYFKVNKSDMEITCANGSQLIFSGLDDVEKIKSITRITGVWIEEASEIEPRDLRQLNLRLRGHTPGYKQIILTFNPIESEHWLKKNYFDAGPQDGVMVHHSTYLDNRYLDDEYRNELENLKEIDYYYYTVYCLGEWGSLGNVILTRWETKDIPQQARYYDAVSRGVDFGFNHPSACLDVGFRDGDVYIFNEIYERGLTNMEFIERIKSQGALKPLEVTTIADSAEPDRIKEFNQQGIPTEPAVKGPDSVRSGIDWLKSRKIFIHPSCTNTIAEIQGWKYKEDRHGNVLDEPVPFKDDAMAALRYAIEPWRLSSPPDASALTLLKNIKVYSRW